VNRSRTWIRPNGLIRRVVVVVVDVDDDDDGCSTMTTAYIILDSNLIFGFK
jgi:hypothetical protein